MGLPKRKLPRLHGYDYSNQNLYFVTLCTHNRTELFGAADGLSAFGSAAESGLLDIAAHFPGVRVDQYVIMPDHIHAIIVIGLDSEQEPERSRPFPTLSTVIGLYKSGVSKRIHEFQPGVRVWQKSFHDRILRSERDYSEFCRYIEENRRKQCTNEK